jgi:uncharacterized protein (DUF1778 family)/GNAT superfamily N-acetyltransferase
LEESPKALTKVLL